MLCVFDIWMLYHNWERRGLLVSLLPLGHLLLLLVLFIFCSLVLLFCQLTPKLVVQHCLHGVVPVRVTLIAVDGAVEDFGGPLNRHLLGDSVVQLLLPRHGGSLGLQSLLLPIGSYKTTRNTSSYKITGINCLEWKLQHISRFFLRHRCRLTTIKN